MYPDENGHVYPPYGSRYNDRDLADNNSRPFGSHGGAKYLRNNKENRGSFNHKDWRSRSYEPAVSSSGHGRPTAKANNPKVVGNTQTYSKVNNQKAVGNKQTWHEKNSVSSAHPPPESLLSPSQTCLKEKHEKVVAADTLTALGQNFDKENDLGLIDLKTLKCSRSGTVEARGEVNTQKVIENIQPCSKVNNPKAVGNTQTCHENNSVSSAHPVPEPLSSPSLTCPREKQKKVAAADTLTSSSQCSDKESDLGSIDWKLLKWSRSGSFVSRSSLFSHSSSSKSLGVDSEIAADVQQQDASRVQSPAGACAMPNAADPSDETRCWKKPRLGWGEGLAKYEKKKVDGHEDDAAKDRLVVSVTSTEAMPSSSASLADKSPRFANLMECVSPATAASVACSSSPGIVSIDDKESIKAANVDQNTTNSCSPDVTSQIYGGGPAFILENLQVMSVANLSSLINKYLNSSDPSSAETGYGRTTSMNKLLLCKLDILKALEVTESEIDSLETELKSLTAESDGCHPCEEYTAASGVTVVPAPLKDRNLQKDEGIDSPGTITSKLAEALSHGEDTCTSKTTESAEGFVKLELDNATYLNETLLQSDSRNEDNVCPIDGPISTISNCQNLDGVGNMQCDHIYDSIMASNKESAYSAVEELNKLLPDKKIVFDNSTATSVSSSQRDPLTIKDRFLAKMLSVKFKEKAIALKLRVFQHFWKEGRVVSVRKLGGKSHKMLDLSRTGYKRNRSSIRSRNSYFAGSHQIVPAEEISKFINGLLSTSAIKPCRNFLKMPSLISDEKRVLRLISNNGLVEDPCAFERERSIINPWTAEERDIFIDKLAIFGKNFSRIASFLAHKTIADCIEFYYKNHKTESFERARKKPEFAEQSKTQASSYLVSSRKRLNRETDRVNLDMLGDASVIVAAVGDGVGTQQLPKCSSRIHFGAASSYKFPKGDAGPLQRSNSLNLDGNETAAADVLAGICGSLSSEAMSSCITSSLDARASSSIRQPLTPDVTQHVDDECSDESCGEIDTVDWTDEEKSIFIKSMSSFGKDFARISQCVGTKTKEQCRIFFSKARKCLELDRIHPGPGDVKAGGSDIEDGCAVQNGSAICSGDSANKIEENLSFDEMKMDQASDTAESHKLKPDVNDCGEGRRECLLASMAAGSVSKNSSVSNSRVNDKPGLDLNTSKKEEVGGNGSESDVRPMIVSNDHSLKVELGFDRGLPDGLSNAYNKALVEVSDGHVQGENRREGHNLSEENMNSKKVECRYATLVNMTLSRDVLIGNISHPSVDAQSSLQVESGRQKVDGLESCSTENSHSMLSQQNGNTASVESSTLFSVPIKYERCFVGNGLPNVGTNGINNRTSDCQQKSSGFSPFESVKSPHILKGDPVPAHNTREDLKVDVNRKNLDMPQNLPIRDGVLNVYRHKGISLHKCTNSRHQSEVIKASCPSQEQSCVDKCRHQASSSSDSDKPSKDVKLFGKIIVSSQQVPNSGIRNPCSDTAPHNKTDQRSLNLKLGEAVDLHSSMSQLTSSYCGPKNIPVGSFGLWNGNRTQMQFPVLDPNLLLTRYPASFANHTIAAAQLEELPLCRLSNNNDHPSNGFSVFRGNLGYNIGQPQFPVLRNQEMQPLTKDTSQLQDVFSEMQRRNGLNVMMGMQQQARMMAGINNAVVRGVHHGDHPVANIPVLMRCAEAQKFSTPGGTALRDDGEQRSKGGDVRRQVGMTRPLGKLYHT